MEVADMERISYGEIECLRNAGCDPEFIKQYMDPKNYKKRQLMITQHRTELFAKLRDDQRMLDTLIKHQDALLSMLCDDQQKLEQTDAIINNIFEEKFNL